MKFLFMLPVQTLMPPEGSSSSTNPKSLRLNYEVSTSIGTLFLHTTKPLLDYFCLTLEKSGTVQVGAISRTKEVFSSSHHWLICIAGLDEKEKTRVLIPIFLQNTRDKAETLAALFSINFQRHVSYVVKYNKVRKVYAGGYPRYHSNSSVPLKGMPDDWY